MLLFSEYVSSIAFTLYFLLCSCLTLCCSRDPRTGLLVGVKTNWNVLNMALLLLGPTSERSLCIYLLFFQV